MAARLLELHAERARLSKEVQELLDTVALEKRTLRADERAKADELQANLTTVSSNIRLEEQAVAVARSSDHGGAFDSEAPESGIAVLRSGGPVTDRTFAGMFGAPKPAGAFRTNEDFLRAVHAASTTGALVPGLLAMTESSQPGGGFAIPSPLAAEWLDAGLEDEVIRPRATVYAMPVNTLRVAAWDEFDHSSSLAGFTGTWQAEATSATAVDGKLRRITLDAKKLMVATVTSNELLADGGQSFSDQLGRKMGQAVSFYLDSAFLAGTGAGQPLGILNDPALITITKEAGQATGTFLFENSVKMFERLHPRGYKNAVWIVNHSVLPQLLVLTVRVKNAAATDFVGGSNVPVLSTDGTGQMRLLGIPVVVTEKTPALSTKGDVILADLSQYVIGLRADISLESSRHAGWTTDSTYWRSVVRVEGMGSWSRPLTPKAGSTRSWVIVLENR